MAKKNTSTYIEEEREQDSRRMMEHINLQSDEQRTAAEAEANARIIEQEAAEKARSEEHRKEHEKTRRSKMLRYTARGAAAMAIHILVTVAMNAKLIAPVLAIPATYICAIYLGWCLCKFARYSKKAGGKK